MNNNLAYLEEIKLKNKELAERIREYKRQLNENLKIDKEIFDKESINNSVDFMNIMDENVNSVIRIENNIKRGI